MLRGGRDSCRNVLPRPSRRLESTGVEPARIADGPGKPESTSECAHPRSGADLRQLSSQPLFDWRRKLAESNRDAAPMVLRVEHG